MALEDLPSDVLARVLALLPSATDVAHAMATCRVLLAAGRRVQSVRFWFSSAAAPMQAGAQNPCDPLWMGAAADRALHSFLLKTQNLATLEIVCAEDSFPARHPTATWTGFSPPAVLAWLRHVRASLEVLHFDNFRFTPESELREAGGEGEGEGGGRAEGGAGRRIRAIASLISRARSASSGGLLRRAGGSEDLAAAARPSPSPLRLRKAGGSADFSLLSGNWRRPIGSGDGNFIASPHGSPRRAFYLRAANAIGDDLCSRSDSGSGSGSGSGRGSGSGSWSGSGSGSGSWSGSGSGSGSGSVFGSGFRLKGYRSRSMSEPATPVAGLWEGSPEEEEGSHGHGLGLEQLSLNHHLPGGTKRQTTRTKPLALAAMLRELAGGPIQRLSVSRVLIDGPDLSFQLPALTVLHISLPPAAPSSWALNAILSVCGNLAQLYWAGMDSPEIAATSYQIASESLKVFCLSRVKIGALKICMPNLEVLDFEHVSPLLVTVVESAAELEIVRIRNCGSADHREDLHIVGATKLQDLEIDASSIAYFNAALAMVRTAGDSLTALAVNVAPPTVPANVLEAAMEMPELRSLGVGRDLWEAMLLRGGGGQVSWTHFEWGRLAELRVDFGTPQFAALYLLHDLVMRCSGLQRLVLRCASKESYAWIQAPMHEYLQQNCPMVELQVELLREEECFSLEALAD